MNKMTILSEFKKEKEIANITMMMGQKAVFEEAYKNEFLAKNRSEIEKNMIYSYLLLLTNKHEGKVI